MDAAKRALLTKRLEEAEQALHDVTIGGAARVFVDQNGERIEYGPASAINLNKYIWGLKLQLGLVRSGPIQPWM